MEQKEEKTILAVPTNKSNIWQCDDGTLVLLDKETTSNGIEQPVELYECEYIGETVDIVDSETDTWEIIASKGGINNFNKHHLLFQITNGVILDASQLYKEEYTRFCSDLAQPPFSIYLILRSTNPGFYNAFYNKENEFKIPFNELSEIITNYNKEHKIELHQNYTKQKVTDDVILSTNNFFNLKECISVSLIPEMKSEIEYKKKLSFKKFNWGKFKFEHIEYQNRFFDGSEILSGNYSGKTLEELNEENNNKYFMGKHDETLYIKSRIFMIFSNDWSYIKYFDTIKERNDFYKSIIEPAVNLTPINDIHKW